MKGAFVEQGCMNPRKKISERDQETEYLHGWGDRTSERPSLIMAKVSSYPKKNSLEVGLHLSRYDLEVGLHLSRHSREST